MFMLSGPSELLFLLCLMACEISLVERAILSPWRL